MLSGAFGDVIANELVAINPGQVVVDILPSDVGFKSKDCGTWVRTPRSGHQATIIPGAWLVGAQVLPGRYRAMVSAGCRWKRLRDFTGEAAGIVALGDVTASGAALVTIAPTDSGFSTNAHCGEWTPEYY